MTTPTSFAIIAATKDTALTDRLAAVAATMGVEAPDFDVTKYRRDLTITPIDEDGATLASVYEYAVANGATKVAARAAAVAAAEAANPVPPEPGEDPSAVLDDHLRAALQALIDDGRISVKGAVDENSAE